MTKVAYNFFWFWAGFITTFCAVFGVLFFIADVAKLFSAWVGLLVGCIGGTFWLASADEYGSRGP